MAVCHGKAKVTFSLLLEHRQMRPLSRSLKMKPHLSRFD